MGDAVGDAGLELLLDRFVHDNAAVRSHCLKAVRSLAQTQGAKLRPRFLKLLAEGDDGMRRAGAELMLLDGQARRRC
jgi:hypothetical protein